jgi:hypothetical protein
MTTILTNEQLAALNDISCELAYPLMNEVARREGWDDPEMDVYDERYPRHTDVPALRASRKKNVKPPTSPT